MTLKARNHQRFGRRNKPHRMSHTVRSHNDRCQGDSLEQNFQVMQYLNNQLLGEVDAHTWLISLLKDKYFKNTRLGTKMIKFDRQDQHRT